MNESDKLCSAAELLKGLWGKRNSRISRMLTRGELFSRWSEWMGEPLGKMIKPHLWDERGILWLRVSSSAALFEAQLRKDHIDRILNQKLGVERPQEVRFVIREGDSP